MSTTPTKRLPKVKTGADCCGCTGCAAVCPKDALSMEPDSAGFLYPRLNPDKCIGCLLCEKVCDFQERPSMAGRAYPLFFGARQKDISDVMKSRSGAVFAAAAEWVISRGGVVFGAGLTEDFKVAHRCVDTIEGLDALRGSKYVQSDLRGIFRAVKSRLEEGRTVLFSGTPCQTSTLQKYIPKRLHDNLYVLDIICHGVPGPAYWDAFLRFVEKKKGRKIVGVNFRDKERFNWKRHQEMFLFEGDSEPTAVKYRFYNDIMFRRACGNCPFANLNRPSDMTIADFWGYEKTGTHINDDQKGINLIIVNTDKGRALFDAIKPRLEWFETTQEYAMQENLRHCTPRHRDADGFRRDFERFGIGFAMARYGTTGVWAQIKKAARALVRRLTVK